MSAPVIPQYKLNIDGEDYYDDLISWIVKLRENNYSVATLILDNYQSRFYTDLINTFSEVKLYTKDYSDGSYTQVFGGYARELLPVFSTQGELLTVACKGYGAALDETHCNRDYGTESSNPSYPQLWNITTNVLSDFVNKSFDDWTTNHALTYGYIADNIFETDLTYINNPYRKCIDVINHVCDVLSAIEAGSDAESPSAAGPHWIVDPSKRFLLGRIGNHADGTSSPEDYWPDWWNTDEAGSTLVQGTDFQELQIIDKSSEFANSVVLATDFRRPAYDYLTDGAGLTSIWAKEAEVTSITAESTIKVVGTHSLKITWGTAQGDVYYPASGVLGWDITKWGSEKTIPRLNFYFYGNPSNSVVFLDLFKERDVGGYSTDPLLPFSGYANTKWHHISLPIGPYWASAEEDKTLKWTAYGTASGNWDDVNGIRFAGIGNGDVVYIDDLHFSGKVVRQAYVSDNITANKEYQKVFISRVAMDDSCVASDDIGDASRLCKAELLRRIRNPLSVQFTTGLRKAMMAGQKLKVRSGLKSDGSTYAVDSVMRILEVEHGFDVAQGAYSKVTATNDLYNTRPISAADRWALQQEFTLVNSAEAKNIRAGAEVDLLIPILKKNYT